MPRPPQSPAFIPPQLATLVQQAPSGDEWLHEMKWDGYRALVAVAEKTARFYTRKGNDWTAEFPKLMQAAARLACRSALLDGEAAVLNERGVPDFRLMERGDSVTYFAFDLLELNGRDLTALPLIERKGLLNDLLDRSPKVGPVIRYSDHVVGGGPAFFKTACASGLEGIVSKRTDAPYRSGRRQDWLKTKCVKRQEFVVGGWLMRREDPSDLGALMVGYFDGPVLKYAGKVGTGKGFNAKTRKSILKELRPLKIDDEAFEEVPRYDRPSARWAKPKMVVEVEFTDFTGDGVLRHPSLVGIRRDKRPQDVVLEVERPIPAPGVIAKSKPRWRRRT